MRYFIIIIIIIIIITITIIVIISIMVNGNNNKTVGWHTSQKRKKERKNRIKIIKHFVDVTILVLIVTGKLLNNFCGILNTNPMILMESICPEVCFFFFQF